MGRVGEDGLRYNCIFGHLHPPGRKKWWSCLYLDTVLQRGSPPPFNWCLLVLKNKPACLGKSGRRKKPGKGRALPLAACREAAWAGSGGWTFGDWGPGGSWEETGAGAVFKGAATAPSAKFFFMIL